jgi:hypothetical protein
MPDPPAANAITVTFGRNGKSRLIHIEKNPLLHPVPNLLLIR